MKLSSIQQEIVNHKEGSLLVMAGAGSGKTRVLTERIKKLLEEEEGNFHVLALTFTNKAAKEMKERIEGLSDIENRSFIGTIHGFCQEIIEKHGYAIGLNTLPHIFEKNDDKMSILIQVFEKVGNEDLRKFYVDKSLKDQESFIYNALTYISLKKKNLKGIEAFDVFDSDVENTNIQKMYNEYNSLLAEQNAMDFDDVILNAYKIFAERPSIAKIYRKLYKYISVDEAQDLNLAQYEFIKILCNGEHKNILMVGDSNQSLYHFNGSDKKYMEVLFVQDFNATVKCLDINYRSSKAIIEIANKIKPSSMDGSDAKIIGVFEPPRAFNDEESEAVWVVEKIESLVKEKYSENDFEEEILFSDIAVLARSRYLFKSVESELLKKHIRFNIKKSGEGLILDSIFVRIFDLGLRVLGNPFDKLHYLEIIKLLEISSEGIESENGFAKLEVLNNSIPSESQAQYKVLLKSWDLLNGNGNLQFRESLKILENFAEKINEDDERAKILSDLQQYQDIWNIYAKSTNSEFKSLQHFKTQIALGLISTNKVDEGVTLSTIHLSKGLEYKVVFIIGMNEGVFPDYRSKKAGGKTLDEEKNIFYVAVTRAERILYITYPENRFMPWNKDYPKPQKPSNYLDLLN